MKIGVLALQGDFDSHARRIREIGGEPLLVRTVQELDRSAALIIPGGESTVLLRLLDVELRGAMTRRGAAGMPMLATCAGLILLAKQVGPGPQDSLGLLDIDVARNAYGRQIDSFIDESIVITEQGRAVLAGQGMDARRMEGVFIRAPRISRLGEGVEVLAERLDEPVLIRQGQIIGSTFHPELSDRTGAVHRLLLSLAAEGRSRACNG